MNVFELRQDLLSPYEFGEERLVIGQGMRPLP